MWWGLAFEVRGQHFPLAASTVVSDGRFYPVDYGRGHNTGLQTGLEMPFDHNGQHVPQQLHYRRTRSLAISGTCRPPELDQRVINTILRGAKDLFASKKVVHTVESYLKQHPAESGAACGQGHGVCFFGSHHFAECAPRLVAQRRLQRCLEQSSNSFLMQLGSQDLAVVAVALREALQYDEIDNGFQTLTRTVFSYHGDASPCSQICGPIVF